VVGDVSRSSLLASRQDTINRRGYRIYSAEVESVLAAHADVVESAVVARPCPVLGERTAL
jgi:acyl-coenzyme A synthetase/AMP-(fatty) acid ligase